MKQFLRALYAQRLSLIPSVVLLVVAAVHVVRVRAGVLSPWKGGGFAMFSTVDSTSNRSVRAYVLKKQKREGASTEPARFPVKVPDDPRYKGALLKTAAEPTREHTQELAGRLTFAHWYIVSWSQLMTANAVNSQSEAEDSTPDSNPVNAPPSPGKPDLGAEPQQIVGVKPETANLLGLKRVKVDGVRIEVFRIEWDWSAHVIKQVKILEDQYLESS